MERKLKPLLFGAFPYALYFPPPDRRPEGRRHGARFHPFGGRGRKEFCLQTVGSAEAHAFSENAENFTTAGATLIGVSADSIETRIEFSSKERRDEFPVRTQSGSDRDQRLRRPARKARPSGAAISRRIYIIAPDGKIIHVHQGGEAEKHIENTPAAARGWHEKHRPQATPVRIAPFAPEQSHNFAE